MMQWPKCVRWRWIQALLVVFSCVMSVAPGAIPIVTTRQGNGDHPTPVSSLTQIELKMLGEFERSGGELESVVGMLYAYDIGGQPPSTPSAAAVIVLRYRGRTDLRCYFSDTYTRYYVRTMGKSEREAFQRTVKELCVDKLPGTGSTIVTALGEEGYTGTGPLRRLFFHFEKTGGLRILFHLAVATDRRAASFSAEARRSYVGLEKLFRELRNHKGSWQAKYALDRETSGMKVLVGEPNLQVERVRIENGNVACMAIRRGVLGLPSDGLQRTRQTFWVKDRQRIPDDIPFDSQCHRMEVAVGGQELQLSRSSDDGRWTVGITTEDSNELVCFDRNAESFVDVGDEVKMGRWFPLYYSSYLKAFVLGRFRAGALLHRWRGDPLGFCDRGVGDIRLFFPPDTRVGPAPWADAAGRYRERVAATADLWFQDLPVQLQSRTPDRRYVWIARKHSQGTLIYEFDFRLWRYTEVSCFVRGAWFGTADMYVDEARNRILAVCHGDLLEFPVAMSRRKTGKGGKPEELGERTNRCDSE